MISQRHPIPGLKPYVKVVPHLKNFEGVFCILPACFVYLFLSTCQYIFLICLSKYSVNCLSQYLKCHEYQNRLEVNIN